MSPAASTAREVDALGSVPSFGERAGGHFSPAGAEPLGDDGGGLAAPTARPSWFGRTRARFRNSVWAPVALKLVGLALAMIALSGVGVASMLSGVNGVPIPLAGMLGADIHAPWLANKSAAGPRASAEASALTALTGANSVSTNATTPSGASHATAAAPVPPTTHEVTRDSAPSPAANASAGMTEDGKVILNLASVGDLRHLPGVGQKRADAILALRARLGRFKQVNDLLRVKGIGVRGLKKIMPHVVLDAPKPAA